MESFRRRGGADAASWFALAAKTRPAAGEMAAAVQLAELVQDRNLLRFALAQTPDERGRRWAGMAKPADAVAHTCWCSITGDPPQGAVAGFVVDAWAETIPETRTMTGVAVHFDRPSAAAPHAVLLLVTRDGQRFNLDYVSRCLTQTLMLTHFRALGSDDDHSFLGQFLPAVFLPSELAVLEK